MNMYEGIVVASLVVSLYNTYLHNSLKKQVDITEEFLLAVIEDQFEREENEDR